MAADYGTAQRGCVARSMNLAFRDKGRSGHITVGLLHCERCVKLCPKRILTLKAMTFLRVLFMHFDGNSVEFHPHCFLLPETQVLGTRCTYTCSCPQ